MNKPMEDSNERLQIVGIPDVTMTVNWSDNRPAPPIVNENEVNAWTGLPDEARREDIKTAVDLIKALVEVVGEYGDLPLLMHEDGTPRPVGYMLLARDERAHDMLVLAVDWSGA